MQRCSCNTWCHYGCQRVKEEQARLEEKYKCLECKENERTNQKVEISEKGAKIKKLQQILAAKEEIIERLRNEKVQVGNRARELEVRIKSKESENDLCYGGTCKECEERKEESKRQRKEMKRLKEKNENDNNMVKELKTQLDTREKRNEELEISHTDAKKKIEELEQKLKEKNGAMIKSNKAQRFMKNDTKEYQKQLEKVTLEKEHEKDKIKKLNGELNDIRKVNKELEERLQSLKDEAKKVEDSSQEQEQQVNKRSYARSYQPEPENIKRQGASREHQHASREKWPQCSFYKKYGECKKGADCEFEHQPESENIKRQDASREYQGASREKWPQCYFYKKYGECKKGKDCKFEHEEVNQRIEECFFYKRYGNCKYGGNCYYKHDDEQLMNEERNENSGMGTLQAKVCRYYQRFGTCKYGEHCRYEHAMEKGIEKQTDDLKSAECIFFKRYGRCNHGEKCRYKHIKIMPSTTKRNEESAGKFDYSGQHRKGGSGGGSRMMEYRKNEKQTNAEKDIIEEVINTKDVTNQHLEKQLHFLWELMNKILKKVATIN